MWHHLRRIPPIARRLIHSLRSARITGVKPSRKPRSTPESAPYPGDFQGLPEMSYMPRRGDNVAQPGEVVWTWVPFEEDYSQGKDRPVLLIGEDAGWLLGLPATSKDNTADADHEREQGRYWIDIGSGEWDSRGRESEVRLDRIVRVNPASIRRIAGILDEEIYRQVVAGVQRHWND